VFLEGSWHADNVNDHSGNVADNKVAAKRLTLKMAANSCSEFI